MSDAFESQAHFEGDVTSEQAQFAFQNPSSNEYEFFGEQWLTDLNADPNFDRFYARNNHSEFEATRQDSTQQTQAAFPYGACSLDCNFSCDFGIEGGPSSMGTGFHTAGIPDEPTLDPSWIQAVHGENSHGLLLPENFESLQANKLYLPESFPDMPFEALDTAGVAAVGSRDMLAHTYPHTIGPDCSGKEQQAELIERIRPDLPRWTHRERHNKFQCKICQKVLSRKDVLQRHFLNTRNCIEMWESMDVATQKSFDPSG